MIVFIHIYVHIFHEKMEFYFLLLTILRIEKPLRSVVHKLIFNKSMERHMSCRTYVIINPRTLCKYIIKINLNMVRSFQFLLCIMYFHVILSIYIMF